MKYIRSTFKLLGFFLLAMLLSVCLVMGVVPVLPKRKEQTIIEIKIETVEKKEANSIKLNESFNGS